MKYYYSITDNPDYVHSIDNVVFVYYIKNYNMKIVAQELLEIRKQNDCAGRKS